MAPDDYIGHFHGHFFTISVGKTVTIKRIIALLGMILCLLLVPKNFAEAAELTPVFHDVPTRITIPTGENIDGIVAVGRPILVRGTVTNTIISIGAPIDLKRGSVTTYIISFGGRVTQEPGAIVTEGIVAFAPSGSAYTLIALASALALGTYLGNAAFMAVFFLFLLVGGFLLVWRRHDEETGVYLGGHYLRSLSAGIFITFIPLTIGLASVLTPSIWAVTVIILALYLLLGALGLLLVSNTIGRLITELTASRLRLPVALSGALIIVLLINVPIVGLLILLVLWILGLGAAWSALLRLIASHI